MLIGQTHYLARGVVCGLAREHYARGRAMVITYKVL